MKTRKFLPIMSNLERLRKSKKETQKDMAELLGCTIKTYANYEKGKQKPYIKHLLALSDHFGVSTDYILGRSNCTDVSRHYISKYTGLSDQAIQGLQSLLLSDQTAVKNHQPSLCVLPALNTLLTAGIGTESFLRAFRDYLNPEYRIPVYHDGTSSVQVIEGQNVLAPNCIVSSSEYDKIGTVPAVYLQHFAKSEDNPHDNIAVPITSDFLKAIALKQIEQAIIELTETVRN